MSQERSEEHSLARVVGSNSGIRSPTLRVDLGNINVGGN